MPSAPRCGSRKSLLERIGRAIVRTRSWMLRCQPGGLFTATKVAGLVSYSGARLAHHWLIRRKMLQTLSVLFKEMILARDLQEIAEAIKEERAKLFAALVARKATEDDLPAAAWFGA